MTMRQKLAAICIVAFATACAHARDQSHFALTIYSTADPATFDPQQLAQQQQLDSSYNSQTSAPGYGVVREIRAIDLQKGDNTIRFTDVAAGIDPTTVSFRSLTAPDSTSVLEQNYEYDLASADKLLQKYLGKELTISRKSGKEGGLTESVGTLLAFDGAQLVLRQKNKPIELIPRNDDVSSIRLADSGDDLITKPTLVWKIDTEKAGKHDAQVTYQTDGLSWRADYNFVINKDDTATDVGAWVTILNQSGGAYPNAKLKLVAGDVQRIKPPEERGRITGGAGSFGGEKDEGFKEKSFFEYHLYTLGRTTSLSNNSTKQIELFPNKANVPVSKTYVYYGLPEQLRYWISPEPSQDRDLGLQCNKKVDIYLLLKNSEQNGMGIPLPAGRIRVYKRDEADASPEFIGEDVIQHTPKDEQVMVKLGSAFDIVGERTQTEFNADFEAHWITESYEIKLRNHKKEVVKVIVKENLFRWSNWEITKSSDKWEKQDYRTIHIPVEVKPDGETTVTYSVKYTW